MTAVDARHPVLAAQRGGASEGEGRVLASAVETAELALDLARTAAADPGADGGVVLKGKPQCPGPSGVYGGSPPCPHEPTQAVEACPGRPCPLRGENVTAAYRGRGAGLTRGIDGRPVLVLSDGHEEPSAADV